MTATIDPPRAAPGDLVTCTLTGAPFDLTRLPQGRLLVALQEVAPGSALSWIASQVTLVDATHLTFVVPGAPGSGGLPIRSGGKRVVFRYGLWQDRAASDLEIIGGAAAPMGPAPQPVPPAAGVHHLRLAPDRAAPGQEVEAELFDGSLDFERISTAVLSVWLTLVGTGAALNYRVPAVRVVDRRKLAFVVPPLGAAGAPLPGDYLVVLRYGFWEGRGQRSLRVFPSAVPGWPGTPSGPRGAVRLGAPSLALPVPSWALGVGWPAPLASSTLGRLAGIHWALLVVRAPFRIATPTAPLSFPIARLVPVIPLPTAAMAVLMPVAAAPAVAPAPRRPVSATVPSGTTLANLAAVCRGQARDRTSAFFSRDALAAAAPASVRPLVDGVQIAPALAELIDEAEHYVYLAWWALDARLRLSADGQKTPGGGAWDGAALVEAIKRRAATRLAQGGTLDVKILIWDHLLDDEYAIGSSYLEPLTRCLVPWAALKDFDVEDPSGQRAALDVLRGAPYRSVAPSAQLLALLRTYRRRPAIADATLLRFPSGLTVATQDHDDGMFGSHHQKLLVTERAAFVGGFNLLREYWDGREHLVGDPRRADSGGPAYLGASGGFLSAGASGMLHDTGAVIRGSIIHQVLELFALRWDQAVGDGRCHERLIGALRGEHLDALARELESAPERERQRLAQARAIDGRGRVTSTPEPAHLVEDALVVATLPASTPYGPVEDIRTCYLRAIGALRSSTAFAYFETQYLEDHGIAKQLYHQWRNHGRQHAEGARPFAHFVLPYNPSTAWPDEAAEDSLGRVGLYDSERLEVLEAEFQMIRWLEIMTARRIYVRGADHRPWEGRWYHVDDPVRQIRWHDSSLRHHAGGLELDSEFDLLVDPTVTIRGLAAGAVMTDSDIAGFCIVGTGTRLPASMGLDYVRRYLLTQEVYIHSKAAAFLEREDELSYATTGSANLNRRSLSKGGGQDSELNVWWKGRASVERFWRDLAAEHLGVPPADVTAEKFAQQGWDNLRRLFRGAPVAGRVVRLDVADRLVHQRQRT